MPKLPILVELRGIPRDAGSSRMMSLALGAMPPGLLEIDHSFAPVGVKPLDSRDPGMLVEEAGQNAVIRALVDAADLGRIRDQPNVIGLFSDPMIAPVCGCGQSPPLTSTFVLSSSPACGAEDCTPTISTGSASDVADRLGIRPIWQAGYSGQGVVIGIVDGGVDQTKYPVVGGWSPNPSSPPGIASHWGGHGNMCAFDGLIAAPNAKIYDLGIGKDPSGTIPGFLSGVLSAVDWAVQRYLTDGTPQILSNSWGMYQQSWDPFPPGHPGNYTHNPNHPVNRKFLEAMDTGILVAFAAGNCGSGCPDGRCGSDVGQGKSIRGSSAMQRSICVGATNLRGQRVGYSSEGPGPVELDPTQTKPDICGYSHFQGHFPVDNGTSAACPVVAGVLALFRSALSQLRQDEVRAALNATAINICAPGYDLQSGYGIINPPAAFRRLIGREFRINGYP